jgi:hypothetical protein
VPETGKLAHIEKAWSIERRQHPQIVGATCNWSRNERIAGRKRKRPIGSHQAIQPGLNKIRVGKRRRNDRQAQFDDAGVTAELGLDQSRVDQLTLPQPAQDDDAPDDDSQRPDHELEHPRPVAAGPRVAHGRAQKVETDESEQRQRTHW